MVVGQIALIALFTWVVVQGVRSGLRSVNHHPEIQQRSVRRHAAPGSGRRAGRDRALVTHTSGDMLLRADASLAAAPAPIGHAAHQLRTSG